MAVMTVAALMGSACGDPSDSNAQSTPTSDSTSTTAAMSAPTGGDAASGAAAAGATAAPSGTEGPLGAWGSLELTDVTGATFTIASLKGTPVFVENFATWCSNCLHQLKDTQAAAAEAGGRAVFVALSVETEIEPDAVASYAAKNGFSDIRFAVMTADFLSATSSRFGKASLTPPSTPKLLVDANGNPGEYQTGFETPAAILSRIP